MSYVGWNGNLIKESQICVDLSNRSFRYGDGCFETMKVINGKLLLPHLHFNRLFSSLELLMFSIPPQSTAEYLHQQILQVAAANKHETLGRIRVTVYRDGEGLEAADKFSYVIQSWSLGEEVNELNERGLKVNFYSDAKKTCDRFSSLKTNNYLQYVLASLWAKKRGYDDAIILNVFARIADATIANVFIVADGVIKTPAVSEGCINGTMRKYLLECFEQDGMPFSEGQIFSDDLLNASEVFFTNAIYGIRWVETVSNSHYTNTMSSLLHQKFITPLYQ